MEELNELSTKDVIDLGKIYLVLKSLVVVYINAYLELNEEYLPEAEIEDLSSDITFYILYEKSAHLNIKHKYFWWMFASKMVKSSFVTKYRKEREINTQLEHLLSPEDPDLFKRTDRHFYRLTKQRVDELILKSELLPTIQALQEVDTELPEYLIGILKNKLKTVSTDKLIQMYKKLTIRYTSEHRKCRDKVHQMFYRNRPRRQ